MQINLTISPSKTYPVLVQVEPARDAAPLQLRVKLTSGETFYIPSQPDRASGQMRIVLPQGTYTVWGRREERGERTEGSATVTVTDTRPAKVMLRLQPAVSLPIEISMDATNVANAPTGVVARAGGIGQNSQQIFSVPQLNLFLQDQEQEGYGSNEQMRPELRSEGFEFRLAPGRYRLRSYGEAGWYVKSASYGVADLFTDDVLLGQGSAGLPLRLTIGSGRGQVEGHVRASAGGATLPGLVWVYLSSESPSLSGLQQIGVSFPGGVGSFSLSLPPGAYTAVAVGHRARFDLQDQGARARLFAAGKAFKVSLGETTPLDLVIAPVEEAAQ